MADLVDGAMLPAGAHEIRLRRDGLGGGVYFLHVEAAGRTASTKVVVAAR